MLNVMTIENFKQAMNVTQLTIRRNKVKLTVSAVDENGEVYKCQKTLDIKKEIVVLVENADLSTACIINKAEYEVLGTL